jgi:hypothetical protein
MKKLIACRIAAVVHTIRRCSSAKCDDFMNATTPHAQSATTKDKTVGWVWTAGSTNAATPTAAVAAINALRGLIMSFDDAVEQLEDGSEPPLMELANASEAEHRQIEVFNQVETPSEPAIESSDARLRGRTLSVRCCEDRRIEGDGSG